MTTEDVHAEIGKVILGTKPGRITEGEILIYDATGMALQDTFAAIATYEQAISPNRGIWFEFYQ